MPISMEHLNAFSTALNTYQDRETLKLGDAGVLKGDGKLRYLSTNLVRNKTLQASNNAVRAELLANLGRAFHLNEGKDALMTEGEGGVRFSAGFMDKLKELLGEKVIKADDFNVTADGVVSSGKPLTARRVQAILTKVEDLKRVEYGKACLNRAVDACTNRIMAILNSSNLSEKDFKVPLRKKFGTTPEDIRQSVKLVLLQNPTFMALCRDPHLSETCKRNLAILHDKEIEKHCKDVLGEPENMGLAWEALRTGANEERFVHATIDGQSYGDDTLKDTDEEYVEARDELKKDGVKWDQGFSPFSTPATERFFTALKARIKNPSILKIITGQLGINGVGAALTTNAFTSEGPLEVGEGLDLRDIVNWGCANKNFMCQMFTADPLTSGGSVDVSFRDNKVVLTQKFHIGPQLSMLNGKKLTASFGDDETKKFLDMPFYMATSTITIPLDQNPSYGTMPQYTTSLTIENL